MRKLLALVMAAAMGMSILTGCSRQMAELALITDSGEVDDGSFNQGAWEGLVKYAEEKGISHQSILPAEESADAYLQSIDTAVENGAKVVVCPGSLFAGPIESAASADPDVAFIAIDCALDDAPANAVGITYAEEQVGFLAGYAAVKEGYTRLGFLGGQVLDSVVKYGYGFVQGAEYAALQQGMEAGSVQITYGYTGDFSESPENEAVAAAWYDAGTQVIFACGGAIGNSVMAAAEAAGTKVIGVDVDQSAVSDSVIISATKNLSGAVYDMIESFYNEEFPGGQTLVLDAASGGVSLTMESSRMSKFTQKDYDTLYAALANNTDNITANIVNTPAADGSVSGAGIPLSCVTMNEVEASV